VTARAAVLAGAAVTAVALGGGCHPAVDGGAAGVPPDTARGVVAVVGADPLTAVQLQARDGLLSLEGPALDGLRLADGVEVWARGRRLEDGRMEVDAFRVRAVDGEAAADGVLDVADGVAALVGPDGDRVAFTSLPEGIRELAGRRVWIVGHPGGPVLAWGLLEPRP
jgi:hypothetical protein